MAKTKEVASGDIDNENDADDIGEEEEVVAQMVMMMMMMMMMMTLMIYRR